MTEFVSPDGAKFSLLHLSPSDHTFGVTVEKKVYELPLTVLYRDHTYTRTYIEGTDDSRMLYVPCTGEKRIFCPDRWAYSCGLPGIVENLFR